MAFTNIERKEQFLDYFIAITHIEQDVLKSSSAERPSLNLETFGIRGH